MKQTLLQLVQSILSSMSSDEVNSISDTTESLQVAEIVKTTFFNILPRAGMTVEDEFFQLTSSTDPATPVLMYRPANVSKLEWIKYFDDSAPPDTDQYKYVTILPVRQFIDMINSFNPDESIVSSFDFTANGSSYNFLYKNDRQPRFCTSIQNQYIIFDALDLHVDDTLQTSKTMCWGQVLPDWSMTDSFIPPLDDQQFPLLLNEAKTLAFYELKQQPHAKADQETRRQWSALQKGKSLTDKPSYFDQLPNFGRRAGGYVSYFKSRGWDAY